MRNALLLFTIFFFETETSIAQTPIVAARFWASDKIQHCYIFEKDMLQKP